MLKTFWSFRGSYNHLNIFGEDFWKPECNIRLLSGFIVDELVDSFDNDDNFIVYFLSTVDNKLFFNFCAAQIKPIGKKLSDIFFQKINVLF